MKLTKKDLEFIIELCESTYPKNYCRALSKEEIHREAKLLEQSIKNKKVKTKRKRAGRINQSTVVEKPKKL